MAELAQPTTLKLNIEHAALGMSFRELRFPEDITLHDLKTKLVSRTGSDPKNMQLRSADGQLLEGEDKTLRELGLTPENSNLTLTDTDSSSIGNTAFDEPKNFQGVSQDRQHYDDACQPSRATTRTLCVCTGWLFRLWQHMAIKVLPNSEHMPAQMLMRMVEGLETLPLQQRTPHRLPRMTKTSFERLRCKLGLKYRDRRMGTRF